ncbi:unnamed protein product [Brassica oleracea]|uniref:Uncharacterized protein n=1 Tax=Brassica oleracea TaxID=3712 RepID=A0A3P6AVN5_BRAOL|nr:unnamed protein product [Brassica oleracea]
MTKIFHYFSATSFFTTSDKLYPRYQQHTSHHSLLAQVLNSSHLAILEATQCPLCLRRTLPVTGPIKPQSSKPSFGLEDWDSYSGQTLRSGQKSGTEELYG